MLGGIFGDMNGIAPGYKGSLSWWKLQLYSEGEFAIDVGDTSESFFYNWSELTLSPWDWFRFVGCSEFLLGHREAPGAHRSLDESSALLIGTNGSAQFQDTNSPLSRWILRC